MTKDNDFERRMDSARFAANNPQWAKFLERFAKAHRAVADIGEGRGMPEKKVIMHLREAKKAEDIVRLARQLPKRKLN